MNMETKELRIGNYLQSLSVEQVNSLSNNKINGYYSSGFSPIPLTEEILDKAGFGMKYATNPQEPNALRVRYLEDFELLRFEDEQIIFHSGGHGVHNDVLYVHQLQNLYFALTGKELKVNLLNRHAKAIRR
jgi:hypothetical protein